VQISTLEMNIQKLLQSTRGRRLALVLLLLLLAVQFVRSNVGTFSIVEGVSMYPTFLPNDVVQARTRNSEVQRGDVVIVADDRGDEVIKRIIGLPGETVTLYRGFVYINRQRLVEPYLPKFTYTYKRNQRDERAITWQLTGDQYFVLGDNRLYSADSRHYGPITRGQIHRIVNTPANAPRPAFCNLWLSETGKLMTSKINQHDAEPNRIRSSPPHSEAKS
jgi:signal peptidase I